MSPSFALHVAKCEAGDKRTKCKVPAGSGGSLRTHIRNRLKDLIGKGPILGVDTGIDGHKHARLRDTFEPQLYFAMKGGTAFGPESPQMWLAIRLPTSLAARQVRTRLVPLVGTN